jgi:hypothetical protein
MPRSFNAFAIPVALVMPSARIASMTGARSFACRRPRPSRFGTPPAAPVPSSCGFQAGRRASRRAPWRQQALLSCAGWRLRELPIGAARGQGAGRSVRLQRWRTGDAAFTAVQRTQEPQLFSPLHNEPANNLPEAVALIPDYRSSGRGRRAGGEPSVWCRVRHRTGPRRRAAHTATHRQR